jgi:hypothetical protein
MPKTAGVMCIRCREFFPTTEELRTHMLLPADELCMPVMSIPERDPEDGITPEMEEALNGRKVGLKIATWNDLWRLLFPKTSIPEAGESLACLSAYFVSSSPADCRENLNHPSSILSSRTLLKIGSPV